MQYKIIKIKTIFQIILLTLSFVALFDVCLAQEAIPLPDASNYAGLPMPEGETGQDKMIFLVGRIIDNVKYIIGAIAILFIIFAGVRMVLAQGNEEEAEKQSKSILWGIIGLALIGLSSELVEIFSVEEGGFLKDEARLVTVSQLFDNQVQVIITFIKYVIGGIAILFILRSGFRLIALGGSSEEVGKDKKTLGWGVLGLFLIIISNTVVNKVFYVVKKSPYPGVDGVSPGINPEEAIEQVVGITNMIISFAGPLAVAVLVAGGIWYVVSAGNEESQGKARKMMIAALIGLLLMFGAFAIVSTFVTGDLGGESTFEDSREIEEAITNEFNK